MTTVTKSGRHAVSAALCLLAALAIALTVLFGHVAGSSRILAQCADTDTEDSFSMNCVPSIVPDTSDQLTEQEVAEPGFNARPGGYGEHGGGGGGGEAGGGHAGGGGGGGHGR